MRKLPVPEKVEKLDSGLMGQAVANRDKYGVWNNVQIRDYGKKSHDF